MQSGFLCTKIRWQGTSSNIFYQPQQICQQTSTSLSVDKRPSPIHIPQRGIFSQNGSCTWLLPAGTIQRNFHPDHIPTSARKVQVSEGQIRVLEENRREKGLMQKVNST